MPQIGGKRFAYASRGKAAARKAILKRLRGIKKRASGRKSPFDYRD